MSGNISDPSTWRPNEDSSAIFTEDAYMQGTLLMCMAYGAVATLSIQCFFLLSRSISSSLTGMSSSLGASEKQERKRGGSLTSSVPLLVYVVLIFALSTACIGMAMEVTMRIFINDRNYPGGPTRFIVASFDARLNSAANATIVLSTFLSDAFLLWRCTVVCWNVGSSRLSQWAPIVLAVAFWLTEFILGTLFLVQLSSTSIWGTVNMTLAFWCFSLAVNILATFLISGRLFHYRRKLIRVFGHSYSSQYTGVVAMFVESYLLYTAFLILYIVPFVRNNPLADAFIQEPAMVQAVSALMIVYRIARGQAWTKDTYAQIVTRATDIGTQLATLGTVPASGTAPSITDVETPDKSVEDGTR